MSIEAIAQKHRPVGVIPAAPWRVCAVSVLPEYRLVVTCNDGTRGVVDLSRLIFSPQAGMYATLRDEFEQVRIELGVLTWPNGADLDPEWVHQSLRQTPIWSVPVE